MYSRYYRILDIYYHWLELDDNSHQDIKKCKFEQFILLIKKDYQSFHQLNTSNIWYLIRSNKQSKMYGIKNIFNLKGMYYPSIFLQGMIERKYFLVNNKCRCKKCNQRRIHYKFCNVNLCHTIHMYYHDLYHLLHIFQLGMFNNKYEYQHLSNILQHQELNHIKYSKQKNPHNHNKDLSIKCI